MVYEMNEILFWSDITSYLAFIKDLENKLNPNKIAKDRRKWADEMAAFILRKKADLISPHWCDKVGLILSIQSSEYIRKKRDRIFPQYILFIL